MKPTIQQINVMHNFIAPLKQISFINMGCKTSLKLLPIFQILSILGKCPLIFKKSTEEFNGIVYKFDLKQGQTIVTIFSAFAYCALFLYGLLKFGAMGHQE